MRVASVDIGTNSVRLLVAEGCVMPDTTPGYSDSSGEERCAPDSTAQDATASGLQSAPLHVSSKALHERVQLHRLQREMRVTRLGAGLQETGLISEESLAKTVAVLQEYRAIWQRYDVPDDHVTIFATAAARSAANSDDLISQIAQATAVTPTIITGEHEALIGFIGATFEHPQSPAEPANQPSAATTAQVLASPSGDSTSVEATVVPAGQPAGQSSAQPSEPQRIVLDIGGGSTEIIVGTSQTQRQVSLPIGVVRMTEYANGLHDGPPGPPFNRALYTQLAAELDTAFAQAKTDLAIPDGLPVIGVAGTVTTLAALHLGLDWYDPAAIHRTVVTLEQAETILDHVWGMTAASISALGAVEPGRGDIFPAGNLILTRFLQAVRSSTVMASESDSLDGQCVYTIMQERQV